MMNPYYNPRLSRKVLDRLAKYETYKGEYNKKMQQALRSAANTAANKLVKGSTVRFRQDGETEWTEMPVKLLQAFVKAERN